MSKKPSTFFNMVSTLFVVALVSSAAVGSVYELTKKPIAQAQLAKKTNAIRKVVPAFNNNPLKEKYTLPSDLGPLNAYPAKENGKLVGTAVEAISDKGFSGRIELMVGFLPNGVINDIEVVEEHETPGLGDKMDKKKSNFADQFNGKDPSKFKIVVKKDGGDVDAITAATISSRAFCDAVQRAYNAYEKGKRS